MFQCLVKSVCVFVSCQSACPSDLKDWSQKQAASIIFSKMMLRALMRGKTFLIIKLKLQIKVLWLCKNEWINYIFMYILLRYIPAWWMFLLIGRKVTCGCCFFCPECSFVLTCSPAVMCKHIMKTTSTEDHIDKTLHLQWPDVVTVQVPLCAWLALSTEGLFIFKMEIIDVMLLFSIAFFKIVSLFLAVFIALFSSPGYKGPFCFPPQQSSKVFAFWTTCIVHWPHWPTSIIEAK